ncbi:hypothetical protein BT96DRAFT_957712 [Gymnopus androsaceus JB14]|uniref:Uncharacterized protein n=1 Tax=Gymnopus androsaceus JB14 TaxID=1447944 RepID=A0A6A4HM97_9AGAR|nr:hypothetical protein BT96DRAFT_957712 [Gymnopus androsaceus JB14]
MSSLTRNWRTLTLIWVFLGLVIFAAAHSADGRAREEEETEDSDTVCAYVPHRQLQRRTATDGNGSDVGLPSVGLTLGNITTKLGNINLTVTNVTISVGDIEIENITIGNITVIISVPLPGASPINAFSASAMSPAISTSQSSGLFRMKRQDSTSTLTTLTPTPTSTSSSSSGALSIPSVTASVGGGPISAGAGNVDTEIGNITIFVGNVNVSIGNVDIKNVSIGNIFILVQIGQPDLTGAIGNLTSQLGA